MEKEFFDEEEEVVLDLMERCPEGFDHVFSVGDDRRFENLGDEDLLFS
jgi:hypothetical protein